MKTESGWTKSQSITNQDGQTANRDVTVERTEDGYNRTLTTTGPGGQTRTRTSGSGGESQDSDGDEIQEEVIEP